MIDNFLNKIISKKISRPRHDKHRMRLVKYFAVIFILFIGIKSILPIFQIRKIFFEDYRGEKTIDITNALEKRRPYNLLTVDVKGLENEIKEIDPGIKTISIVRIFPNVLKVKIVHREPIAQVIVEPKTVIELEQKLNPVATFSAQKTTSAEQASLPLEGKRFFVDSQGKMTNGDNIMNSDLDKIIIRSEKDILEGGNITVVSDLIQSLHDINFNFLEIIIFNKDTFVVKYEIESYVLFTGDKDIRKQVRSLQEMLERFTIEGIKPKKIDLRFEKALIVF